MSSQEQQEIQESQESNDNPLDLQTAEKPSAISKVSSVLKGNFLKYLLIGLTIVSIVVILLLVYRRYQLSKQTEQEDEKKPDEEDDDTNEEDEKFTRLNAENDKLRSQIQQLQITNQNYVAHINRLADQLEEKNA